MESETSKPPAFLIRELINLSASLHSVLNTRLPDPWDFFRFKQDLDLSILLNSGSYLAVHFAFIAWFVKLGVRRLEESSGKKLKVKDKCIVAVVMMVPSIQILWPTYLIFTHFLTCGFYPWVTTSGVIFMHIPLKDVAFWKVLNTRQPLLGTALSGPESQVLSSQVDPDEVLRRLTNAGLEAFVKVKNLLQKVWKDSWKEGTPPEFQRPPSETPVAINGQGPPEKFFPPPPPPSTEGTSSERSGTRSLSSIIKSKTVFSRDTSRDMWRPRTTGGFTGHKMGYCGRCWRVNNLPFRPGFSGLRQRYVTRSGLIHGPTHYFLTTEQFIEQYGRGRQCS